MTTAAYAAGAFIIGHVRCLAFISRVLGVIKPLGSADGIDGEQAPAKARTRMYKHAWKEKKADWNGRMCRRKRRGYIDQDTAALQARLSKSPLTGNVMTRRIALSDSACGHGSLA